MIARQLCAGLAASHAIGVLHRDLKPANIMIDGRGRARITDFGLAAFAGEVASDEVFAGTPAYMAPEQLSGREVSVRSDLYSLGLVLYELFTGRPAYKAASVDERRRLQSETTPSTPSSLMEGFDPAVERVSGAPADLGPGDRRRSPRRRPARGRPRRGRNPVTGARGRGGRRGRRTRSVPRGRRRGPRAGAAHDAPVHPPEIRPSYKRQIGGVIACFRQRQSLE